MPKMNTYSLARPYPGGLSITDAILIVGNRRRPIRLEKAGDVIDLAAVDVETFARSSYVGLIRRLFLSGVIMSAQQEISNERHAALENAYSRLQESGGNFSGLAGAPTVVQLEPGIQVGVMGIPDEENRLPDLPTPPGMTSVSAELEPGIVAPGAPGNSQVQVVQDASKLPEGGAKASKKKGSRRDPAGDAKAPAPQAGFQDWKNNLDFPTQKSRAAESTDKAFLAWVSANDESRQLQKIAAARLAEITRD